MVDGSKDGYCVECRDRLVTHVGANFCKLCAADFYNEVDTEEADNNGD